WPLAPRFDTVGWLARDARTLARAGDVLLPPAGAPAATPPPVRLLISDEALPFLDDEARGAFTRAAAALAARLGHAPSPVVLGTGAAPPDRWLQTYLALQNAEAAALHADWIARHRPR